MGAPQQRAHTADHLTWRERLGDIVIGANVEAERAVTLLATRAEDDDGKMFCLGAGTQRAADIDPGHLRHHPVDDGEIRTVFLDHLDRLPAILGAKNLILGLNQIIGQKLKLIGLIIGNENTDSHLYPSLSPSKAGPSLPQHCCIFVIRHGCAMIGRDTANRVSPSSALLTSIAPRCRLTICLTMARPSPVPPILRERALSTR